MILLKLKLLNTSIIGHFYSYGYISSLINYFKNEFYFYSKLCKIDYTTQLPEEM